MALALVPGGGSAGGAHHGGVSALETTGLQQDRMAAPGAVHRLACAPQPGEAAMKGLDSSRSSLGRRRQGREAGMTVALRQRREHSLAGRSLATHAPDGARGKAAA